MVERQPSKLRVAGSNPVSRSRMKGEAGVFVVKRSLVSVVLHGEQMIPG